MTVNVLSFLGGATVALGVFVVVVAIGAGSLSRVYERFVWG